MFLFNIKIKENLKKMRLKSSFLLLKKDLKWKLIKQSEKIVISQCLARTTKANLTQCGVILIPQTEFAFSVESDVQIHETGFESWGGVS